MSFVVAFTGHRPDKLGGYVEPNYTREQLMIKLTERLGELQRVYRSDLSCLSGMALGFDQWAAKVCISLGIKFTAVVPFAGQELRWPVEAQREYRNLLAHAKEIRVVSSGGYSALKMQKRNEWMVDNCNLVVAAWNGSPGGTANCILYARRIGRSVDNLIER